MRGPALKPPQPQGRSRSRAPAPCFRAASTPGARVRPALAAFHPPRRRRRARGHSPTTVSRLPAPKGRAAPVKHSPGAPHPNRGAPPALT